MMNCVRLVHCSLVHSCGTTNMRSIRRPVGRSLFAPVNLDLGLHLQKYQTSFIAPKPVIVRKHKIGKALKSKNLLRLPVA